MLTSREIGQGLREMLTSRETGQGLREMLTSRETGQGPREMLTSRETGQDPRDLPDKGSSRHPMQAETQASRDLTMPAKSLSATARAGRSEAAPGATMIL
jgi:hypothetical protein